MSLYFVFEQENLLDKHEFIRWLVDRVEHVKSADTKALQLHLPLVLRVRLQNLHIVHVHAYNIDNYVYTVKAVQ